ncbi:hypothetical protein [Herbaspirillum robiniae]|uniref:hypothetical protein n=1 Tax=Herbaspirillum robiniae TaxID=2014887 RepID=UPI0011E4D155|nr:hypothetical protein [Herbaspirillum robiniae]
MKFWSTIALALALLGCSPSTESIGETVKSLMQKKFSESDELKNYKLEVVKVDVIHESGNKYRGMAKVMLNGAPHDVGMSILSDGDKIMYEIPPENLGFLVQEAMKQALAPLRNLMSPPSSRASKEPVPEKVQNLIGDYSTLNEDCRGRPGDDPVGMKACDLRNEVVTELRSLGWCYGKPGQVESDKDWVQCSS